MRIQQTRVVQAPRPAGGFGHHEQEQVRVVDVPDDSVLLATSKKVDASTPLSDWHVEEETEAE